MVRFKILISTLNCIHTYTWDLFMAVLLHATWLVTILCAIRPQQSIFLFIVKLLQVTH